MADRDMEHGGSGHHNGHHHRERESHHDRDRDKDRDRDREYDKDRERGRDREREVFGGEGNGHGHGVPSSIVRIVESGVGFRKETAFEGDDADRVDDGYDRDHRYGSAGSNGTAGADTIFITNLPESVTEEGIAALLSEAGAVKIDRKSGLPLVKLFRDKETGAQEAEVVLDDPRSATGIVNWFNGYDYKGSKIQVALGYPMGPGSPGFLERRRGSYGGDYDCDFPQRGRGYRGGRGRGRYSDRFPGHMQPPHLGMGQDVPPFARGFGDPYGMVDDFPAGGESFGRNNPNVTPREGDWICSEPTCGNLNFARRTHCNNCNKPRRDMILGMGPPNGFRGPPPHGPFMGGPPMGRGLGRGMGGFGEPPGVWGRGGLREFDGGLPGRNPGRLGGRFDNGLPARLADRLDFRPGRYSRDRDDFRDREEYRERERFDRPNFESKGFYEGGPRDREREDRYRERRSLDSGDARGDRRPMSPMRPRWGRDMRERSRSPVRSLSREYQRRDDRRDDRRDRREEMY